jgi:hypothetical protein
MGGGLFSEQQITARPLSSDLDLNEWRSLPPGEYSLSVMSKRISVGSEMQPKTWDNTPVPVQSNWISFRVIKAESAWQSSLLSSVIKVLDSAKSTAEEKENAAKELRFLNSEDAAHELVLRFWNSSPESLRWDFEAGLWGNPFRQTTIQEMKAVLRESRDGTRDWFIDALVNLELQADPRFRLSRYGTPSASRENTPDSLYEQEHNRRASKYASEAASGTLR